MEDAKFIEKVLADFKDINNSIPRIVRLGDLFSIWFTSNILLNNMNEEKALNYFIGGSNDCKLDIGIADDDHELITLAQCKFPDGNKLITDNPNVSAGSYTKDVIDDILTARDRLTSESVSGNDNWKEFADAYREKLAPDSSNLKLIVAGFGNFPADVINYAIEKNVDIYDFKRIKDQYIRNVSPEGVFDIPETLELACKEGNTKYEDEKFKTFSYFVDISDVGTAVEKYQDGLFIDDLRYKLAGSSQSKIASDIEATIMKHPEKLTILNNGLTIACESLIPLSATRVKLIKPKILNGCQTSWAIQSAFVKSQKANRTLKGYVYARIVETKDPNYIKDVTNATNNQNPITARDKHAGDDQQKEIFFAFSKFGHKPILYDYREGLVKALERSKDNIIEHFYTTPLGSGRPKPRIIDNILAAQLYLALLGEPIYAKTNRKDIFEEEEVYKTIFSYQLPADQRFNNDTIGIKENEIKLRTGKLEYFIEDVFFAHAVYQLAEAYAGLYDKKMKSYTQTEINKPAYIELAENFSFMKRWNYIVVGAVNYIVNSLSKDEESLKKLREKLIKSETDADIFWRSATKLQEQFNFDSNKDVAVIVKDDAQSPNYVVLGRWINSVSLLLYDLVRNAKRTEGEGFNMRKFIELNPQTYRELIKEIGRILAIPRRSTEQFPQ